MKIFYKLPFDISDIDGDVSKKYFPDLSGSSGVLVGTKKYFLHSCYSDYGLDLYNFEAKPDDVYVLGYVRSGNTLTSEIVWLLANNLDYKQSARNISFRFPLFEADLYESENKDSNEKNMDYLHNLNLLKEQKERRFIQSNLPLSLLPPSIFENDAKIIYCARNPKDIIVSQYHYLIHKLGNVVSFGQFFNSFKHNWGFCLPYFEHIKEGWAKRNDENVLFLFYEDIVKDMRKAILGISEFLEKRYTDYEITNLVEYSNNLCQAAKIAASECCIRRGKVGGVVDYFVGDIGKEVDQWIEMNLKGTDIKFPDK